MNLMSISFTMRFSFLKGVKFPKLWLNLYSTFFQHTAKVSALIPDKLLNWENLYD